MLKNIKKTRVILIGMLFLSVEKHMGSAPLKKIKPSATHSYLPNCAKELRFEKNLSLSKILIVPAIAGTILYFNKKNFLHNIKQNPLLSVIAICLLINFLIDTTIQYKQINQTICLFHVSKTISRYLLYAIAIKNTMLQLSKKDASCTFQEEEFFKIITYELPLSFQELEQFAFDLLHNCVKTIHKLHIKIPTDVEEQIYLLCKNHITLNDISCLYGNNHPHFYPDLEQLLQNPSEYCKNAAFALNALIKEQLQGMIKHQPEMS